MGDRRKDGRGNKECNRQRIYCVSYFVDELLFREKSLYLPKVLKWDEVQNQGGGESGASVMSPCLPQVT